MRLRLAVSLVALLASPRVLAQEREPLPPPPPSRPEPPSLPLAQPPGAPPAPPPDDQPPYDQPPYAAAPEPPPIPEDKAGWGAAGIGGVGLAHLTVDLGQSHETTAGGAFLHLGGSLYRESVSGRLRVSGLVGGGSGGFEGAYSAEAWIGGGAAIGRVSQVFARIGVEAYAIKNDEIEASTASIPALAIGYQLWTDAIGFELSPRVGLAPRTEYEPGDESEGRRHWRRLGLRAGYGGAATIIATDIALLDAAVVRVADSDPLTVLDGRLCAVPFHVALCGFGQYWRSRAIVQGSAATIDVPSVYVGGAIGVGIAGSGVGKPFSSSRKP